MNYNREQITCTSISIYQTLHKLRYYITVSLSPEEQKQIALLNKRKLVGTRYQRKTTQEE